MASALSLLRSNRFLPIYIAQFGGAFNDHLFKSALLIIVAFQLTDSPETAGVINNLAALLLILPYFILSTLAGQLADKGRKAFMIQNNKIAEICISAIATFALFSQQVSLMIFVLFLLGAQSAMFGPNKYAILPQLLSKKELVTGNALVTSGTFIATLIGTLTGSILAQQDSSWVWIGGTCLITALIGYLAARKLPETEIGDPNLIINWNLFKQTKLLIRVARQTPRTWSSILGTSWFWFIAVAYLTQIPTIVRYIAIGDETVVSLFLGAFIVGIGFGCACSAYTSSNKAETGLVPFALLLLGICGLYLAIGHSPPDFDSELLDFNDFINTTHGKYLTANIFLIGLFLGSFLLPMYTELQESTRIQNRARIISINNVLNAALMFASSLLSIGLLGVLKIELTSYLLIISCLSIVFSFYLYKKISHRTLRFLAQISSWVFYKIDKKGFEKLPSETAAILVCNHVSYADAIILYGSYERPIRFLIYKAIYDTPILKWLLKDAKTISLCSPSEDRKTYEAAISAAIQGLKNGQVVCIFPEGKLSPKGEIGKFHRGVEKLIEGHPVEVYPMAIKGLAGSYFSRVDGPAFSTSKFKIRLRRRDLRVSVGDPIPAHQVSAHLLQTKVTELYDQ